MNNLLIAQLVCKKGPIADGSSNTSITKCTPDMTSYSVPSGVVTCSLDYSTVEAWKAFDGVLYTGMNNSRWAALPTAGIEWINYQLPAAKPVNKAIISCGWLPTAPNHIAIYGSNNGSTFTLLFQADVSYSSDGQENIHTWSNSTSYVHYRVEATYNGNIYSQVNLGEIKLIECQYN